MISNIHITIDDASEISEHDQVSPGNKTKLHIHIIVR